MPYSLDIKSFEVEGAIEAPALGRDGTTEMTTAATGSRPLTRGMALPRKQTYDASCAPATVARADADDTQLVRASERSAIQREHSWVEAAAMAAFRLPRG
jgi:hypothetical protein